MAEIKTKLSADARGFNSTLRRSSQKIRDFSRSAKESDRQFKRLNKTSLSSRKILGSLGGIALTSFAIRAGKNILSLDERLRKLGAQANLTIEQVNQDVKPRIFEVAKARGKTPEQVLAGIEAVVERIGQPAFALKAADSIAKISKASSATTEEVGATFANLREKLFLEPKEIERFFDILASQGEKGSFTLQNMAKFSDRLTAAMTSIGVQTEESFREFGAFIQLAKRTAGTPERTVTAVIGAINRITNQAEDLQAIGVDILDPEELKKGNRVFRSTGTILKSLIAVSKTRKADFLTKVVGEEPVEGLKGLILSLKKDPLEFGRFAAFGGDLSNINKDFDLLFGSGTTKITNLQTEIQKLIETVGKLPIEFFISTVEKLTIAIEKLGPTGAGVVAAGVGGLGILGAAKTLKKVRDALIPGAEAVPSAAEEVVSAGRKFSPIFGAGGAPTPKIPSRLSIAGKAGLQGLSFFAAAKAGEFLGDELRQLIFGKGSPQEERQIEQLMSINGKLDSLKSLFGIDNNIEVNIDSRGQGRISGGGPNVTNTLKVRKLTSGNGVPKD